MVYKIFDKLASLNKSRGRCFVNKPNYQLVNELHKQLLENLKKEQFIRHLETIFGVLI